MKAEIKYRITTTNGETKDFEEPKKAVSFFQMMYDKLREANKSHFEVGKADWWPSLKIDMFLDANNKTNIKGTITIQFNCEENGKDVHKLFRHTLSTEIIPCV